MEFKIPNKIEDQLDDVKTYIEACCNTRDYPIDNATKCDLMLKYIIAETLIDIRLQLFEISHYGIGTD